MSGPETTPEKRSYPDAEADRLILLHAQNWVCDDCGYVWWETDAYACPSCGKSAMHRWGEHEKEQ